MVPYVKAEIKRVNDIESDRKARYASAMKDFEENGVDLENEAAQKDWRPSKSTSDVALESFSLVKQLLHQEPGMWWQRTKRQT